MHAIQYAPPPGHPLRPFVHGIWQIHVAHSHWRLLMLGLSLKVETSRAILALPAHELTGLTVPAQHGLPGTMPLFERLHEASTFRDRWRRCCRCSR